MDDRKLVLEQPSWTERTRSLFRRLDESPELQAQFVRDPGEVLAETFGAERAACGEVSAANRVLYEILSDPTPIETRSLDPADTTSPNDRTASYAQLFRSVMHRIDGRADGAADALELVNGFNVDAEIDVRTQLATRVEAELQTKLDTRLALELRAQAEARLEAELRLDIDTRIEAELRAQLDTRIEAELRAQLETRLDAELRAQLDTRLEAELRAQLDTRLEAELRAQLDQRLEAELRAQLEARLDAELRAQLDTRLEAELRAQLNTRLDTELRTQIAAQVGAEIGAIGPVDRGTQARAAQSFSRLDLQKFSGFIATRAAALRAELRGDGSAGTSA